MPESPLPMDQMIYTLSEVHFRKEYPRSQQPVLPADTQNTQPVQRFLYLLSRILVTEGRGGNAAVSLNITEENNIELCYSKPRQCTGEQASYIRKVFAIATDPTYPPDKKCVDIFDLVVAQCNTKIIELLQKVSIQLRALMEGNDLAIEPLKRPLDPASRLRISECETDIRELVGVNAFPEDTSLNYFIRKWFRHLIARVKPGADFNWKENDGLVFQAINIAYYLMRMPQTALTLDGTLYGRLGKLACYRTAVEALLSESERWDESTQRPLVVKEIISAPPDIRPFTGDFLNTLNHWAEYKGSSVVSMSDVIEAYPEIPTLFKTQLTSKMTHYPEVHCECSLALAFASPYFSNPTPRVLHIVTSKSMCWLCYEFISAIHLLYPHLTITVSPFFKKISCGWTCPPGTPPKVVEMIQQHLHDGLDEVLACSISAAQMSDSIAFSSGSETQLPNSWKAAIRRDLADRPANGIL
ncbi:hypothetical protein HOY82DRAFT_668302 [Tuber indicum]|nr:hypothetical protein HOY82DRAFT_668302 [Tuber indicum]